MSFVTAYMEDAECFVRLFAATGNDDLRLLETTADVIEAQRQLIEACEP